MDFSSLYVLYLLIYYTFLLMLHINELETTNNLAKTR
jgi:hypothetical protein